MKKTLEQEISVTMPILKAPEQTIQLVHERALKHPDKEAHKAIVAAWIQNPAREHARKSNLVSGSVKREESCHRSQTIIYI